MASTGAAARDKAKAIDLGLSLRPVSAEHARKSEANKPPETPTFEQVVRHQEGFIRRLLFHLRVPVSEIDDATQEVLLGVHRNLSSFDPTVYPSAEGAIRAWLFRICERAAVRTYRRTVKRREVAVDEDEDEEVRQVGSDESMTPGEAFEREELTRWMRAALAQIPPERAAVVSAYYLQDTGMPEVTAMLGIVENTGWSRLRLGLKDLRAAYARRRAAECNPSRPIK